MHMIEAASAVMAKMLSPIAAPDATGVPIVIIPATAPIAIDEWAVIAIVIRVIVAGPRRYGIAGAGAHGPVIAAR